MTTVRALRSLRLGAAAALAVGIACQDVEVTAVDAARIEISPSEVVLLVDSVAQFTVSVLAAGGQPLSGRSVTWSSDDDAVATVDAGAVRGMAPGETIVRASSEGASVSATVTVEAGPAIVASPASVDFSGVQSGATPGDRTVAITNGGAGSLTGLSAAVRYAAGQPTGWLEAALSGGTAPTSLVLGADQGGLAVGSYDAFVDLASASATNSPLSLPVRLLVVAPLPAIGLDAATISFAAPLGGSDPAPQAVGVRNVGGGTLSGLSVALQYPTGGRTGWLTARLAASTAPTRIDLQATLGSLPTGVHTATIIVSAPGAQNSPQSVDIRFTVGQPLPRLAAAPASLTFAGTEDAADPAAQTVAISNAGGGTVSGLAVSVTYPAGAPNGWLTGTLNATTAPATLTARASLGALAPGSYSGTLLVASSTAENSPLSVPVTFDVAEAAPVLAVSPSSVRFAMTTADDDPAATALAVTNAGGGTLTGLTVTTSYGAGEPTGWLSASLNRTTAPATLTVDAARGALAIGSYEANVRLTAPSATNSPIDIPVTFAIADVAPAAPTSPAASSTLDGRIDLDWTDASDNEDRFDVERSFGGGDWTVRASVDAGETEWSDSLLAASATFFYRVRACNAVGCSSPTSTVSATTPPARPSALVANALSATQVQLNWVDNSSDETGFAIQRSGATGTTWTTLFTTSAGANSAFDFTTSAQVTYRYRVRACRNAVCSSPSNEDTVTTTVDPPGVPASPAAATISSTRIDVSWSASTGVVGRYRIERRTGTTGPFAVIDSVAGTILTFANSGLTPSTTYSYRITACNVGGCSAPSPLANATTFPGPPGAPGGLTATALSSTRIDLAWGAATGVVDRYRIERRLAPAGTFAVIDSVAGGVVVFSNTGLTAATAYEYRVTACNTGGCSPTSAPATATTLPNPPGIPGALSATPMTPTRVDLNWTASSGTVNWYRIERRTGIVGVFAVIDSVAGGIVDYSDTDLSPSTDYGYRVHACNAGGCSSPSNEVGVTTLPAPPGAPTGVVATALTAAEISLSWTAASGSVEEYRIERRTETGAYTLVATVGGGIVSHTDGGLATLTLYVYRITACNSGGCSVPSDEASATTLDQSSMGSSSSDGNSATARS